MYQKNKNLQDSSFSKKKVRRIILNLAPIQIAESMPGVLGAGMQTIVNIPNGIYIMRRHKDI